jgi:hypothetical protein
MKPSRRRLLQERLAEGWRMVGPGGHNLMGQGRRPLDYSTTHDRSFTPSSKATLCMGNTTTRGYSEINIL